VSAPVLVTGMARSGGSWVSRMLNASGAVVHINEPFNRHHPPGLSPGILRVPAPLAYQYIGPHNASTHLPGFQDLVRLRYHALDELRTNRRPYDLAKMLKYWSAFVHGRLRGRRALIDDPYTVFDAQWLAEHLGCTVVMIVRHPAAIVSSLERIGSGWHDNIPALAAQAELIEAFFPECAGDLGRAASEPFDPIAHGALLWTLVHRAIAQQIDRRPDFILVRYEDLATDPIEGFRDLYRRLDLSFDRGAEAAVREGSFAGQATRTDPWGRVGLSRTAYQPMDSHANAYAWRDRLSLAKVSFVLERTRSVASQFYSEEELRSDTDSNEDPQKFPATRLA
jgi:hypothetical protein